MKKSKIIISSLVTLTTASTLVGIGIPSINGTKNSEVSANTYSNSISSENTTNTSIPLTETTFEVKTLYKLDRRINKEVYKTDLMDKYGSQGFKYPGWNYDYEIGNNKYLKLKNGKRINMMNLVYNEKVKHNNENVFYVDPFWIQDEIKAGSFKKHPAAETFYKNKISDNTLAVANEYTVSTDALGQISLGLYAPPGEVITFRFDDETFKLIEQTNYQGLKVVVNNNYWNNYPEGDSGQISNRYPYLMSTFVTNKKNKTIKFGSPFGGAISIQLNSGFKDKNTGERVTKNLKFVVSGAVENLYYVHGKTTKDDWEKQLSKVKSGEITSPIFSFLYDWGSADLPLDDYDLTSIPYPQDAFRKWNEFTFLSSYLAGYDLKKYPKMRVNLHFCDDVWGNAGAWGGGSTNNVYAPISWGINAFLKGIENFNINTNWGMMHEINHNFQQNEVLFKKRGHGETNQVSMAAFAMLSDVGINRNPANRNNEYTNIYNMGWTRFSNSFSNIDFVISKGYGKVDEYSIYSLLMYTVGAAGYMNYIRNDYASNNFNLDPKWSGLKEIQEICDYFKVNFWPAFEKYGNYWRDSWPLNEKSATSEEKKIIEEIYKKDYPIMDFVGNLYAAGSYLYSDKKYIYTGDTQAPYSIPAGENYIFDFDKYINSLNPDFSWSDIEIPKESKQGVKLVKNGKKVVYKAADKFTSEIDEFDITIKNTTKTNNKGSNVPGYKWKVKVMQSVSGATVYAYEKFSNQRISNREGFNQLQKNDYSFSYKVTRFDKDLYFPNNETKKRQKQGSRIKFTFIAPEDNQYTFYSRYNDAILLKVDNKEVFVSNKKSNNYKEIYSTNFTKGQKITFDVYLINHDGNGWFDMKLQVGNKEINSKSLFDNMLVPNLRNLMRLTNFKVSYNDFLTSDIYKYKTRWVNTEDLNIFKVK